MSVHNGFHCQRNQQADAKRRAEHDQKVAQQKAAAAAKRAKKELDKHEREKKEDEQRYASHEGGWTTACMHRGENTTLYSKRSGE